jgi:NADP-dependent 3-hydroxy acid dehydrogenase YdfG
VLVRSAVRSGHRVVAVARNKTRLDESVAGLPAEQVRTVEADVTDWHQISDAVREAVDTFGRLDVVVANAGLAQSVSFTGAGGADPASWHEMVSTNVLGTALTARAALSVLTETKGHLVLLGSISGKVHRPGLYSATKWAVTAMAASIRAELVGSGVRITVVQPGVINTQDLRDDLRDRPKLDPETVADALLFAVGQPATVDLNEIVIRPTGQPADC